MDLADALWQVEQERCLYLGCIPEPRNVTVWMNNPGSWQAYHAWAHSLMRRAAEEPAPDPVDELVRLLAPVLTHGRGMDAIERENAFRKAITTLVGQNAG